MTFFSIQSGLAYFIPLTNTPTLAPKLVISSLVVPAIETVHAFTLPLGIGLAQMTILAVQGAAELRDVATATALCQFMNTMGGSVGLIMFSSLYSNKLIAHIRELPQSTIVSNTWFKPRHH
ncbi:hypothetical protein BC938DRAFT_477479 [Jimgerdemannia flammicorona]|uniref:Uncharacterized protein n=1 Tax=Jimgerdemannia flammicorona TaxID=994334 RepID=A0A433QPB3_9FUNG|nr:hypothetical protein BC938DRAFT_477479 [Jimgerdemannia flammicorona]